MPVSQKKVLVSKFPLRLMPSVRRAAKNFSHKEGVSLNQFINIAVAEKLAHLQHEEWLAQRPKARAALIAEAPFLTVRVATRRKIPTRSRMGMCQCAENMLARENLTAARVNFLSVGRGALALKAEAEYGSRSCLRLVPKFVRLLD